jgi:hypothetical protein
MKIKPSNKNNPLNPPYNKGEIGGKPLSYYKRGVGVSYLIFFLFAIPVFAANISLESKSPDLALDQEFLVNVSLNTGGEYLNAVGGKLVFPAEILDVREVRDGNSAVNFWVEKPNVSQSGTILFSGITPGGLFGDKNFLFSVLFRVKVAGKGSIDFGDIKILKNDGNGTPADATISNFSFSISTTTSSATFAAPVVKDTEPPENFTPVIGQNPEMFGGKYFLVFATQDKISGMDHFEVKEGFWGKYEIAESPYVLKNRYVIGKIYVKAVDKSGNEREVSFSAAKWYEHYILFAIIFMVIAAGFAFKKFRSKKNETGP